MKRVIAAIIAGAALTCTTLAHADDADYCDKVRARAAGDADLLVLPSISLAAIKFPSSGLNTVVGGSTTPDGYQGRASLTWSLSDAYQSTFVRQLADKDCAQHAATMDAQNVVEQINDVGKRTALQMQLDYLRAHKDELEIIQANAAKRLAIGNATIIDQNMLGMLIAALDRKAAQAAGALEVIQAHRYIKKEKSFAELIANVKQTSMAYERKQSQIRGLLPWDVEASGGFIPPMVSGDSANWFAQLSLTYKFGGLTLGGHEDKYLAARAHELDYARYELADTLTRFRDVVDGDISAIEKDLRAVDMHISQLKDTRTQLLAHMDAPNAANAEAVVSVQLMDAESDNQLLVGMITELNDFYGDK